jgi:hypothetical protein
MVFVDGLERLRSCYRKRLLSARTRCQPCPKQFDSRRQGVDGYGWNTILAVTRPASTSAIDSFT